MAPKPVELPLAFNLTPQQAILMYSLLDSASFFTGVYWLRIPTPQPDGKSTTAAVPFMGIGKPYLGNWLIWELRG